MNKLYWNHLPKDDKVKQTIIELAHKHTHIPLYDAQKWADFGIQEFQDRSAKKCLKLALKNYRTALVRYAHLLHLVPGFHYPDYETRFSALENAITDLKSKIADEAAK